jgi:nucleoside phosphorylase
MVSGSAVVAQSAMHLLFKKQHRKSLAVDMECYGVYKAAATCGVPRPDVICIKSVSDLANRDKSDDYQQYGSQVTAAFSFVMLDRYFSAFENGG